MDLNEELMITDMSELEKDVEYYINFIELKQLNGLYKLVNKHFRKDNSIRDCRMVKIDEENLKYYMLEIKLYYESPDQQNNLGIFTMFNTEGTCNIYRILTTDYVLK